MIKKLSLVKIIAALCICNVYLFTCGVMGTVGGEQPDAPGGDSSPESPGDTEANGFGTQDFLTSDSIITEPALPPDSTASTVIESLGLAKPTLDRVPVSSSFKPSDLTDKYPIFSSTVSPENSSSTETEDDPVFVDTYEPSSSSSTESSAEPSHSEPSHSEPPDSSSAPPESSSDTPNTSDTPTPGIPADPDAANRVLTVSDSGEVVSGTALDIISRIVMTEMGSTVAPEAIKAQAVAAYTYVRYFNDRGSSPSVILSDRVNDSVRVLVASVIGQAVYYNGSIIQATYSASSAGYTASSKNVWGTDLPYLKSVYCELDADYDPNYGKKKTFTSEDMKSRVYNTTGISLTGEPSSWFSIDDHFDGKYVADMSIGGYHTYIDDEGDSVRITGRVFREKIMRYDIRSNAFDISYDAAADEFTVTTYGFGHGVGMSQNGAINLARYWGWDYVKILEFYYQGAKVQ